MYIIYVILCKKLKVKVIFFAGVINSSGDIAGLGSLARVSDIIPVLVCQL